MLSIATRRLSRLCPVYALCAPYVRPPHDPLTKWSGSFAPSYGILCDDSVVNRWENFYQGSQRAYLAKDEYVTGAYGIEGRFPFLDARVVQEQLYLAPELKNTYYKAAAQLYMKKHGYPVEPCVVTPAHPFGEGAGCKKVGFLVPSRPRKVGATSGCIGPACKPWF